jgi:hypothetical protein
LPGIGSEVALQLDLTVLGRGRAEETLEPIGGRINARCVINSGYCDSLASVTDVETRWRIDLAAEPLADCISLQGAPQRRHLTDQHAGISKLEDLLIPS